MEFEKKNKGRSLRLGGGLRRVRGLRGGPRSRGLGSFGDRRSGLRGRSGLDSGGLGGGGRRRQRLKEREWKKMQCTADLQAFERLDSRAVSKPMVASK